MLRGPNPDLDPDSVGGHAGTKLLMYEHSRTSTLALDRVATVWIRQAHVFWASSRN